MNELITAVLDLNAAERQQLLDEIARATGQRAARASLIRRHPRRTHAAPHTPAAPIR